MNFFPFKRFVVEGESMLPAYRSGDCVLVFRWGNARPGDVVVFSKGGLTMIKRVAERIGDRLMVRGDNYSNSTDSLDFGAVPQGAVVGKVIAKY